jgi:outer membrane lipoprotein-sorting protein
MRRSPLSLTLALVTVLVVGRSTATASLKECSDYRGKLRVRVLLQPDLPTKMGEPKAELGGQLEQVFVRPDQMLLNLDMNGIRQQRLAQGSTEQEYAPLMGMVIERKYRNLDKADENPIIALQTSIVDLGRHLRETKSLRTTGSEKVLEYDCDVVEADSKEFLEKMGGLLSLGKSSGLLSGKTKAWIVRGYGVPVKMEMYTAAGNLGVAFTVEELRFNTGVKPEELRLDVPEGTKKVSVEVDLAAKDWQQKMNQDLRKAIDGLNGAPPRS